MKIDMRDAFFLSLFEEARKDESIVVITGDHGAFPLVEFSKELPKQYFNVGIAEQNMVSVAAGLATVGFTPFVYGISPFVSIRALEQLTLDVCANGLPVNVVSVGAGFTYSTDGPTHHGLQDLAAVSSIPGITILNSSDPLNTAQFVRQAIKARSPHYIRIEKEKLENLGSSVSLEQAMKKGFSIIQCPGLAQVVIVASGFMSHLALEIVEKASRGFDLPIDVLDLHQVAPLPVELIETLRTYSSVYVVEDSYKSVIGREIALKGYEDGLGIPLRAVFDAGGVFYFQGDSRAGMHESAGLSSGHIAQSIKSLEGR